MALMSGLATCPMKALTNRFRSYFVPNCANRRRKYSGACSSFSFKDSRSLFSFVRSIISPCTTLRKFSVKASTSTEIDLIKQLRERTGAPMKDIKSVLLNQNWDIEAAQKELRRRGIAVASKKMSRVATEGLLALAQNERAAAVVELNCETDFVAKNDIFQHLASSLAKLSLENTVKPGRVVFGPDHFEGSDVGLSHPKLSRETSVESAVMEVAAMMGENVRLRRGFLMSAPLHGFIFSYLHTSPQPGMGRIVGLLTLELENPKMTSDLVNRVGSELAMHVVASKPLFLTRDHISPNDLESEHEILRLQAESSGKPKAAMEKMVEGRLDKYIEEVVLLEQKFVVQDTLKVKTVLSNLSKEIGCDVRIGDFCRIQVGEGINEEI